MVMIIENGGKTSLNHLVGWAAFACFIFCCCYFWLKRVKSSNYPKVKSILNSHYILGVISLVLAIIHTGWNLFEKNEGFLGYICLVGILFVTISGAIMYFKGLSIQNRAFWRSSHRIITVFLAVVLILHIVVYFIMS